MQQFGTVKLQCFVLCDAIVDENIHAAVLSYYVAEGVPDFVAKGWNSPGPRERKTILVSNKKTK